MDDVGDVGDGQQGNLRAIKRTTAAVAPGLGRAQPDFSLWLWLQAGSLSKA